MAHEQTLASGYTISDDLARFDLDAGHRWISRESYWAQGMPRDLFERALANSLTIGVYDDRGRMGAMARVVTDRATFGWITDVFVDQAHRGAGLGKAMMAYLTAHPDLQGFRRLHLATRDAHGLYAQFGFGPLTGVDRWMEVRNLSPYGPGPTPPAP